MNFNYSYKIGDDRRGRLLQSRGKKKSAPSE